MKSETLRAATVLVRRKRNESFAAFYTRAESRGTIVGPVLPGDTAIEVKTVVDVEASNEGAR